MAKKLSTFWDGAALGLTGYNFPTGLAGERQRVDLVVPDGGSTVTLWRLALLAATAWGGWAAWRQNLTAELVPWLAFLASKIAVVAAFYGYARQGASIIPVVALPIVLGMGSLPALSRRRLVSRLSKRFWIRAGLIAALTLVAVEGQRWSSEPQMTLDGREVGARDPWPVDRHEPRTLQIESR